MGLGNSSLDELLADKADAERAREPDGDLSESGMAGGGGASAAPVPSASAAAEQLSYRAPAYDAVVWALDTDSGEVSQLEVARLHEGDRGGLGWGMACPAT